MKPANSVIVTVNGGSSSIKFALYQVGEPMKRKLYGTIDRIGLSGTTLTFIDTARNHQDGFSRRRRTPRGPWNEPHQA